MFVVVGLSLSGAYSGIFCVTLQGKVLGCFRSICEGFKVRCKQKF